MGGEHPVVKIGINTYFTTTGMIKFTFQNLE